MFRTLLVPLDGSKLAEGALPYAIRLARAGQGHLVLLRAALTPPPGRLDGLDWEQEQLIAIKEAEDYLQRTAQTIDGVPVDIAAPYGRAADTILKSVEQSNADAVIMVTHGRTGLPHLFYGSVTEAVLTRSTVPVLVLQPRAGDADECHFDPSTARLLVPLDGSAFDPPAVDTAVQALGAWGEITLVQVVGVPHEVKRDGNGHVLAYLDQQEAALTREAREYLNAVARGLRDRALPIRTRISVRMGEPAREIAMAAMTSGADLIVMATHGRTGLRRAVMGSVAGDVLRRSLTPVLLVHPHVVPGRPAPEAEAATTA
jgi:nucleotide-binding universal stress UspA family protein